MTTQSNNIVCIYHKNCNDGFAAALALRLRFPEKDIEFIPEHPGFTLDNIDVEGKEVYVFDLCPKPDVLKEINKKALSFLVIDHHKTAKLYLEGALGIPHIFDVTKSGAVLTWKHLFPNKPVPHLFDYIQDRDLWIHEYSESSAVSNGLYLEKFDFEVWKQFLNGIELFQLINAGRIIQKYIDRKIEKILEADDRGEIAVIKIDGHKAAILNNGQNISEIGHALCERYPVTIQYFDVLDQGKRVFSLRGNGKVDVSEIAKKRDGGGHFGAAGFSVLLPEISI